MLLPAGMPALDAMIGQEHAATIANRLVIVVKIGSPTQFELDCVIAHHTCRRCHRIVAQLTASGVACDGEWLRDAWHEQTSLQAPKLGPRASRHSELSALAARGRVRFVNTTGLHWDAARRRGAHASRARDGVIFDQFFSRNEK